MPAPSNAALQCMIDHPLVQPEPMSGCWLWCGTRGPNGHGQINIRGKVEYTHRVSWLKERGEIPQDLWVLHKCNNACCCNPDHLYLGTPQNNVDDMWRAGRNNQRKGSLHQRAKMTEETVLQARARYRAGARPKDLAAEYGLSAAAMCNALTGHNWEHIP